MEIAKNSNFVRATLARDYAQDGLIAMWDGYNNSGWGKYDTSADFWTDLVSGVKTSPFPAIHTSRYAWSWENGGLKVVNTYGGEWGECLLFGQTSPSELLMRALSNNTLTLEIAHRSDYFETGNSGRWARSHNLMGFYNSQVGLWYNPYLVVQQNVGPRYQDGTIGYVVQDNVMLPFANGTFEAKTQFAQLKNASEVEIMYLLPSGYYALPYQHLFCTRIYNRALSQTELQKNHEIDKERFGL